MRSKLLLIPVAVALLAAAAGGATGAGKPKPDSAGAKAKKAIAQKQAQARQVLSEIASIDEELNMVSEQYDGATYKLGVLRKRLAVEQVQLTTARKRYASAEKRAAKLAVWLYTSNHASSLDVILGARNLGELLRLSDAEQQLSKQAVWITNETASAKKNLELKVRALARDRTAAAATVKQIATVRAQIMKGLDERRTLLGSVEHQVAKLQAAERARQARLAALARARLEAELAAERKAAAEAAAKRQAELAAAAKAQALRAARAAQAAKAAKAEQAAQAAQTTQAARTTTPAAPALTPPATTSTPTSTSTSTATSTDTTTTTTTTQPALTTPTLTTPTTPTPVLPPTPTLPGVGTVPAPVLTGPLPAGHPEAAQLALAYLGVPYVWGGSTPTGFDCSGLVSYVYAQLGVSLPHFAAAQYTFGAPVPKDQLQPGDLVFFDKLDHVGIYLGDNLFIDAPHTGTFVRIDSMNDRWYSKKYVGARRI